MAIGQLRAADCISSQECSRRAAAPFFFAMRAKRQQAALMGLPAPEHVRERRKRLRRQPRQRVGGGELEAEARPQIRAEPESMRTDATAQARYRLVRAGLNLNDALPPCASSISSKRRDRAISPVKVDCRIHPLYGWVSVEPNIVEVRCSEPSPLD